MFNDESRRKTVTRIRCARCSRTDPAVPRAYEIGGASGHGTLSRFSVASYTSWCIAILRIRGGCGCDSAGSRAPSNRSSVATQCPGPIDVCVDVRVRSEVEMPRAGYRDFCFAKNALASATGYSRVVGRGVKRECFRQK